MAENETSGVDAEADELPPLWQFVPLGEFSPPRSSSEQIVRKWSAFKRLLRRKPDVEKSPFMPESELQRLPSSLLEPLTGPVEWTGVLSALEDALAGWSGAAGEPKVVFVVGPPWSGNTEVLRAWAAARQAPCVEAPTYADILQQKRDWVQIPAFSPDSDSDHGSQPWIMPELERCYLRHAEGLDLVRYFLEHAMRGNYGPGIIGCDSWAWAYLQHVWPVQCPSVLTLQGFDGTRLTRLLRQLSVAQVKPTYCFKNASNGHTVLCAEDHADAQVSGAVLQLAVRTRGNVGLALRYWRDALRSEPESEQEGEDAGEKGEAGAESEHTVWVAPLATSPVPPVDGTDNVAFTLHTLLLHRGVPEELLPRVLPMSRAHIMATLLRLRALGIVEESEGDWQIAPLAYVGVCTYLRERNYLMDQFQG
ncbi:MAG: hypothetical protein ABR516_06510 [Desulfuromonadaceae bacterium]